ncbi:MAG: tRNA preQ1(34) S-adenosylmethionine ribosyltransferase-isomerase QueA [Limisphaerales bacterium]
MQTADFDFKLPPELIAQHPLPERAQSKLLALDRKKNRIEHKLFLDLPYFLRRGDALVLNDSRVIPARLRGENARGGGRFEFLLLEENGLNDWWAMVRPGRSARIGTVIRIGPPKTAGGDRSITATVREINANGNRRLGFDGVEDIKQCLNEMGEVPLPPYIARDGTGQFPEDKERYQTVFARNDGSVAAPTAGLHFTNELLDKIRRAGVSVCFVTLHVGPGTFLPVKTAELSGHTMHEEWFSLGEETVRVVNAAKKSGARVFAAGTTTVRVLESVAARNDGKLNVYAGKTSIFIFPPYVFKVVDALVTNFHLPRSTLLMLASAFASPGETRGRDIMLKAYAEAIRERYRFYSYGDAMLIL